MAVIEVKAERLSIELVRNRLAGRDDSEADPRHPVHLRTMDPVEMNRVGMGRAVAEPNPKLLTLVATKRGAGNTPVVSPRCELHSWRHLDFLVLGHELPLAQDTPAGKPPSATEVEVSQHLAGMKSIGCVVHRGVRAKARMVCYCSMVA
jgi:hypothetical protein